MKESASYPCTNCVRAFLTLALLLTGLVTSAQTPRSPASTSRANVPVVIIEENAGEDSGLRIPPLDTLIALAKRNSPAAKMQEALMQKNEYQIRNQKQLWMDGIGTDITAGFGNQSLLVQQPTGEITNFTNFNNGYRIGATVRLSLYDLFGRRSAVEMAYYEYDVSRYKKDLLLQELTAQITARYYGLIAAENIFRIKTDAKHATHLNRMMAEKEFNEGNIPVSELSRIIEISVKAATELELARKELFEQMRVLELMVGKKLF
jgi:outer membrane protein TolC